MKLISAFVFATRIKQSLYFLNSKFLVSNNLLWLYIPVCVGPDQKPRRPVFSQRSSNVFSLLDQSVFENVSLNGKICSFMRRLSMKEYFYGEIHFCSREKNSFVQIAMFSANVYLGCSKLYHSLQITLF